MTLDQLKVFVAVAEREHMTQAAEQLHLTQSAVSAAIHSLESRHSVILFHRIGRRIELTPAGRTFLDEARRVLQQAAAAESLLSELTALKRGYLDIAASQTISSYWLPPRLVRFGKTYPDINVRLTIGNTSSVVEAVLAGTVELGLIEGTVEANAALDIQPVDEDQIIVVVAAGHPWAGDGTFSPQRLGETPWVFREKGSGTRSEFEKALEAVGLAPGALKIMMELPSNEAITTAVAAGGVAAAVSELVVHVGLLAGVLAKVQIDLPRRSFCIVRHHERKLGSAGEALAAFLSQRTA